MTETPTDMLRMTGVVAGYGGGDVLQGLDITVPVGRWPASSGPTAPASRRC